jgi:hypothetical protein
VNCGCSLALDLDLGIWASVVLLTGSCREDLDYQGWGRVLVLLVNTAMVQGTAAVVLGRY